MMYVVPIILIIIIYISHKKYMIKKAESFYSKSIHSLSNNDYLLISLMENELVKYTKYLNEDKISHINELIKSYKDKQ